MGSILSVITVRFSPAHNGIEVIFPERPEQHVLNILKGIGFKWSPASKLWYRRFNPYTWTHVHEVLNLPTPPISPAAMAEQARDYKTACRRAWPADPAFA